MIRRLAILLSIALLTGACGDSGSSDAEGTDGSASAVEAVVRDAIKAQNDKDADAFVALFTDDGLEAFGGGETREEITSGKSEGFGEEPVEITEQRNTSVDADAATTDAEFVRSNFTAAQVLYLSTFSLVKEDGDWLIDGFEVKGSPDPDADVTVLDIKAQEYAFVMPTDTAPGNVAFRLENNGKEEHEILLFRGPDGTDVATAKAALENLEHPALLHLPEGYVAEYAAYALAGETVNTTFAKPLKAGTYFMVCYVPEGGYGETGYANADGKPHVVQGMISRLIIRYA